MNAVGQHLVDTVASTGNGIWCTNCHNQLGQEIWKAENMVSLVHGVPGKEGDGVTDAVNIRALGSLQAIVNELPGVDLAQAVSWLDPTEGINPGDDDSYAIWAPDPGLCDYVAGYFGGAIDPAHDGAVATVEVNTTSAASCTTGGGSGLIDCSAEGGPAFYICGSVDGDGDFSVNAMDFCTTPDCVAAAQATLPAGSVAVPVPFSAATDGRDHWLASGEPHCADCHAAPFTEQSGNINAYPPFNYPRKASLMRYSRGHQDISCQGCHESIHGLYPVTPNIDTTTYAQAAALNHDGSHGPLKCGTCHEVNGQGIPMWINGNAGGTMASITNYDSAVAWAHTYTEEQSVLDSTCQNCHGVQGNNWSQVSATNGEFIDHPDTNSKILPRGMMDKAEIAVNGGVVFGFNKDANGNITANVGQRQGVCSGCHSQEYPNGGVMNCGNTWREHLEDGRVSQALWEDMSPVAADGTRCSW
jgi:cytochrome c553